MFIAIVRPLFISIHAPPRGATPKSSSQIGAETYFNSRPSARGDVVRLPKPASQHGFQFTPLREGRRMKEMLLGDGDIFQFTPLREGRPACCSEISSRWTFQFTPLREGRPVSYTYDASKRDFNSRPSARGDGNIISETRNGKTFQFTPLREGRPRRSTP